MPVGDGELLTIGGDVNRDYWFADSEELKWLFNAEPVLGTDGEAERQEQANERKTLHRMETSRERD